MISITLKHSPVGRPYRQRLVLKGLGLRRLHQTVQRPQTPQVLGLIDKVKHLIYVPLKNGSIPHDVHGYFGAEHVLMKPAREGTGIIAGGAVRAMLEVLGAHNIVAKTLGRGNPFNVVRATLEGLARLKDPGDVRKIRQMGVGEVSS